MNQQQFQKEVMDELRMIEEFGEQHQKDAIAEEKTHAPWEPGYFYEENQE